MFMSFDADYRLNYVLLFIMMNQILLQITQTELASLLTSMGKVDALAATGIKLGGEKYM
jgi:hypothetical protein